VPRSVSQRAREPEQSQTERFHACTRCGVCPASQGRPCCVIIRLDFGHGNSSGGFWWTATELWVTVRPMRHGQHPRIKRNIGRDSVSVIPIAIDSEYNAGGIPNETIRVRTLPNKCSACQVQTTSDPTFQSYGRVTHCMQVMTRCISLFGVRACLTIGEVFLGFDREVHYRVLLILAHILDVDLRTVQTSRLVRVRTMGI